ncbi:MAG: multidrug transporter AcrB [Candidatus Handelsmanbacteria bacterium RIFCSPLOWO2_12_FULL_64_10]|uniref:Multidrug transporter AcrB n=1 Tax=Handelsmanbacteria sp. (strain RIFCSPLOWO2_12_FULL_64_10) TaxID=1817868 RepID=A0A1F6C4D2_HANXR|nr:MAG: multidrug transporter AcrB [Candidatus Handelsmanbacteria bacterium RIFCSPLOWO2_12_FULL_64_10]
MKRYGMAGRIAHYFIDSKLTPLLAVASMLLGVFAVIVLPREEEPQIVVPMADVFVQMPGASAKEVEERVVSPMEKLLWEIPGVEYIYSTSSPGMGVAIVRFRVGEDLEKSLVQLYNKLYSNFDRIPPGASEPLIKPRSIDDVPILALTLWSDRYDGFMLRRIAAQVEAEVKSVEDVSETAIIGGQRRQVRVLLDAGRMAGHGVSPTSVLGALGAANRQAPAGSFSARNVEALVEAGSLLRDAEEVGRVVVGVFGDRPVHLRDVASVEDGPEAPATYVFFGAGAAAGQKGIRQGPGNEYPAVTISVAKRKGTNAIVVADRVMEKVEALRGKVLTQDVKVTVTRNYGETANEKSNELLEHMLIAVVSVTILIALALGRRESGVVALAVPVTLALTLVVFALYGYTLNRITLFALIFSIGILVDDAIVVVENIVRHLRMASNRDRSPLEVSAEAVDEVGNPTILATFTVIAAIVPMGFVGGLMGPYMRPIPVGASAAMVFSLLIAFIISPWAAYRLLKGTLSGHGAPGGHGEGEDWTTRLYRRLMVPLIRDARRRMLFLAGVVFLLLAAVALVPLKAVTVKMLPFDNKSEFQVIVDTPEGTTLEQTTAVARAVGDYVRQAPEVTDYQVYAGTSGPYNFNGLVRHYFLRRGPNVADVQVNLAPKGARKAQSHEIAKRLRPGITEIARRAGARVKVAESPPGPPVLSTLVAEVYGPEYGRQIEVARQIERVFEGTEGVVDVDTYIEDDQPQVRFVVDQEKAALNGVSAEEVAQTLRVAVGGAGAGLVHLPTEQEDVPIFLRLPISQRSSVRDLSAVRVRGAGGRMIPLGELARVEEGVAEKNIYHKNLKRVVYVTGDVAGRQESPVYAILKMDEAIQKLQISEGYEIERYTATQPFTTDRIAVKWDGEWHITYEVFRDLGLAFGAVLVLIYILVVAWFQSFKTPVVIMSPIPLTLIGILPAHALLGAFFTATSMIGFIAGAGIIVRNSIILVDFIELRLRQGMPLAEAVVDAGAVRFRPMLLTAAAVIVGSFVILFDPIFQGLAVSLMAGEVASTLLSRMAVPVLYYMANVKQTSPTPVPPPSPPGRGRGGQEPFPLVGGG